MSSKQKCPKGDIQCQNKAVFKALNTPQPISSAPGGVQFKEVFKASEEPAMYRDVGKAGVGPFQKTWTDVGWEWGPYIATGAGIAVAAALSYVLLGDVITSAVSLPQYTNELITHAQSQLLEATPLQVSETFPQVFYEAAASSQQWFAAPVLQAIETNPQVLLDIGKTSIEAAPSYVFQGLSMLPDITPQVLIDGASESISNVANSIYEWASTQAITDSLPDVQSFMASVGFGDAVSAVTEAAVDAVVGSGKNDKPTHSLGMMDGNRFKRGAVSNMGRM